MALTFPRSTATSWPTSATRKSALSSRASTCFRAPPRWKTSSCRCFTPATASRRSEQRERALQALELVGLGDRADHHPNQLSGGQQQRVAIARALVNQPSLLLADEPTGNLDSQTSIEIMGVFQKLNDQGITIVMVTHELDIARYTKRNVILRDGNVVSDTLVANRLNAENELQQLRRRHNKP